MPTIPTKRKSLEMPQGGPWKVSSRDVTGLLPAIGTAATFSTDRPTKDDHIQPELAIAVDQDDAQITPVIPPLSTSHVQDLMCMANPCIENASESLASDPTTEEVSSLQSLSAQPVVYEGPDNSADAASHSRPAEIFVLIVSIDEYKNPRIGRLAGCMNDGRAFKAFLIDTFHVPPAHIVHLVNEKATREAILSAFEQHLIKNDAVQKGDSIIFHYAGHGSRVKAPDGWVSEHNQVETIVPYDEGIYGDETVYGIPDYALDALMRRLASEKGDNITAIFDSCHSGGITRTASAVPRALQPGVSPSPLPPTLDRDIWEDHTGRQAHPVLAEGFFYKARSSHVLLAACEQDKAAYETTVGIPHGRFSVALLQALTECDITKTTYEGLIEQVVPKVQEYQRPQCEGRYKSRIVFNAAAHVIDQSDGLKVSKGSNGIIYINAGSIHGVTKGDKLTILLPPGYSDLIPEGHDMTSLVCEVDKVESFRCQVTPLKPDVFERLLALGLTLKASLPVASFAQNMKMQLWRPDSDESPESDIRIDLAVKCLKGGDVWQLERFDPLTTMLPNRIIIVELEPAESPRKLDDMTRALDAIAVFNHHLYRHGNSQLSQSGNGLEVRLQKLEKTERYPVIYSPFGDNYLSPEHSRCIDLKPSASYKLENVKEAILTDFSPFYGLTLVNNTDYDLYPYVLYFDPSDYSIQVWYTPPSTSTSTAPLPRRKVKDDKYECSELPIGYGSSGTDSIRFSLPDGTDRDSGFLKIFASTANVNMELLMQDTPFKRNSRLAEMQIMLEVWDEWTYVLTCTTKQGVV
ncbi:uncharacterized protein LAESUDRAFT_761780 [Laetiporus sulphureus 93-53]|uniref:Peptidase C14 caspase domain-containing protein n=1 Tax=Laetiporus sulphureus 93-53 TaxID=1314785 RepID=A0A165CXR1_9APHY|nr:uncharacterized protein LAESUDRAFT_761780 [Laetiporus sulphureus 93-53]KZT03689.1 hypothetical protein LAESUDRAFT_761780 [Laetiporus sulphureus 93-53]